MAITFDTEATVADALVGLFVRNDDTTWSTHSTLEVLGAAADMISGDFDGEGSLDLAVSIATQSRIAFIQAGADGLTTVTHVTTPAPVDRMHAFDVNGDGVEDLLARLTDRSDVVSLISTP